MTQELIEFKVGSLTLQEPMALITNWMMGLVVLTFVPFFLKNKFRMTFKKLFVF